MANTNVSDVSFVHDNHVQNSHLWTTEMEFQLVESLQNELGLEFQQKIAGIKNQQTELGLKIELPKGQIIQANEHVWYVTPMHPSYHGKLAKHCYICMTHHS